MANIVVLGAGVGGTIMAYELVPELEKGDRLTVIGEGSTYHFTPSNRWVAVGWRKPADIEVDLNKPMSRKRINFVTQGTRRVHPEESRVELMDGTSVGYDYLVIATGPDLAFDEVPGLGPDGFTQSICHVAHASRAFEAFEAFCADPGPIVVGAAQGTSTRLLCDAHSLAKRVQGAGYFRRHAIAGDTIAGAWRARERPGLNRTRSAGGARTAARARASPASPNQ